ncbi:hypothetical protein FB45DRAFT_949443 [Roridomyces roridus]|uniref:Uncharacterized protein n=1 Tax=Roridomyces roridus TaxID=1738132 RepID=A0AAD7B144_9AGAR|nr:hypothetical protein FB45DRAFT_963215 [Roridomyces roridus]KAJ7606904.1 hypothetical protein FB45DRAFT_949443 [Roridomyces roridus]
MIQYFIRDTVRPFRCPYITGNLVKSISTPSDALLRPISRLHNTDASPQGKPLQTGFQWGMEMILGVNNEGIDRVDMHTVDILDQDENRDSARQRFQRRY